MNNQVISSLILSPNFTNTESASAENDLNYMIDRAQTFGVEITNFDLSNQEIIDVVRTQNQPRLDLVENRLIREGLTLAELPRTVLLDRLLGLDALIKVCDKNFGIDITIGTASVLYNKMRKANFLQPTHQALGIDHFIVLRIRREISDDLILDFFGKLENLALFNDQEPFALTMKY